MATDRGSGPSALPPLLGPPPALSLCLSLPLAGLQSWHEVPPSLRRGLADLPQPGAGGSSGAAWGVPPGLRQLRRWRRGDMEHCSLACGTAAGGLGGWCSGGWWWHAA
uniref:Uncharacterized protein n=1 Tax=Chelonoidis abingdonii TaxID=106734 RepID=A0A8C0G915_CHEAB